VGFDADILAVDGDPLRDPTAIARPRAVYAAGRAVDLGIPSHVRSEVS
jgi:imidazolonepropionase-like amidohydrolase